MPPFKHRHDYGHKVTVVRSGDMITTTRTCKCGASQVSRTVAPKKR